MSKKRKVRIIRFRREWTPYGSTHFPMDRWGEGWTDTNDDVPLPLPANSATSFREAIR